MRDHDECEEAMAQARAAGNYGELEWLATRCDRAHGHLPATETHDPQSETTRTENEEQP